MATGRINTEERLQRCAPRVRLGLGLGLGLGLAAMAVALAGLAEPRHSGMDATCYNVTARSAPTISQQSAKGAFRPP